MVFFFLVLVLVVVLGLVRFLVLVLVLGGLCPSSSPSLPSSSPSPPGWARLLACGLLAWAGRWSDPCASEIGPSRRTCPFLFLSCLVCFPAGLRPVVTGRSRLSGAAASLSSSSPQV